MRQSELTFNPEVAPGATSQACGLASTGSGNTSAEFRAAVIGEPLRGGGASTTIELDGDACLRDLRVAFGDGRSQLYREVDVCRRQRLQLRPFPHEREAAATAR